MKDTKFRILLDIHEVRSQATIPVKVGDVSCKIYITLVEGGKPYKIHENSFGVFTGKKGDDNYIFNNCIVENGIIRYDFTPQTVAAAGVLECEIRIYDEDGGVLTTPSFNIVVDERAVNDSELASASEFAFLDEILVNEGQRIENERNRNEAFNNLGIDLEDDGEVISIVKTDIDGSQEKSTFLKYADVIPSVTATASGSAITIDSANAPLQNLKLFGKTEQDGTPTPTEPKELKSVGDSGSFVTTLDTKNLLNVPQEIALTSKGYAFQNVPILLSKGNYIFSCEYDGNAPDNVAFSIWDINSSNTRVNETFYMNSGRKLVVPFTIETSENSRVYLYQNSGQGTIRNCQIELGTEATPYEPCNKQTLTNTDTLRSDGTDTIKDEIDLSRGIHTQKNVEKFFKDCTWIKSNPLVDGSGTLFYALDNTLANSGAVLSSHFRHSQSAWEGLTAGEMKISTGYIMVGTTQSTLEEFTQWITDNNVKFVFPLKTPIETPISESELNAYRHLTTNKGTTTILSEADMVVDYYINKPNAQAIGDIHTQINKDYFKLQQAIISTGGSTL